MRDDRNRWNAPGSLGLPLEGPGVTVTPVTDLQQVLISGPDVRRSFATLVEWPDVAQGGSYTLSLRRDRVMVIGGPARTEGWQESSQQAVTEMSDGYEVLDIAGPAAFDLLRRGAELSLTSPSRSVARLLFGMGTILYRHGSESTFRVHVGRSQAEAFLLSCHESMKALPS